MIQVSRTARLFPSWRGAEPYRDRVATLRSRLHDGADALETAIRAVSFERFEAIQAAQPRYAGYTHVSPAMHDAIERVPAGSRETYFRGLLLWHIERIEARFPSAGLPDEFAQQIGDSVHRILDQIAGDAAWADPLSDLFMKDLGIVRLSVIPAVAQVIYPYAGVIKAQVLRAGPGAWAYIARAGGFRPYLEIHTHAPMIAAYFNPEGWDETYRLTTLLYEAFPRALGMLGTSWFYDPQLLTISPRIAYLQTYPLDKGAYRLAAGTDPGVVATATATSPTRRALVAEGKYHPQAYALVWSKTAMRRLAR